MILRRQLRPGISSVRAGPGVRRGIRCGQGVGLAGARQPSCPAVGLSMTGAGSPIRVLELRSVRGTGGGPEKTILLGARYERSELPGHRLLSARPARSHLRRGPSRSTGRCRLRRSPGKAFVRPRRVATIAPDRFASARSTSFTLTTTRPTCWPCSCRERRGSLPCPRCTAGPVIPSGNGGAITPPTNVCWPGLPRVVAVSSEIGRELIRCGADPARVTTVLNGIDHRQFRRDPARVAGARAALGRGPATS